MFKFTLVFTKWNQVYVYVPHNILIGKVVLSFAHSLCSLLLREAGKWESNSEATLAFRKH